MTYFNYQLLKWFCCNQFQNKWKCEVIKMIGRIHNWEQIMTIDDGTYMDGIAEM